MRILILTLALSIAGCEKFTDEEAKRVLNDSNYSDIELTGRRWFGCSEPDIYKIGFKAKNIRGKDVSGVIC